MKEVIKVTSGVWICLIICATLVVISLINRKK